MRIQLFVLTYRSGVGAIGGLKSALLARKESCELLRERGRNSLDYLNEQAAKLRESADEIVKKERNSWAHTAIRSTSIRKPKSSPTRKIGARPWVASQSTIVRHIAGKDLDDLGNLCDACDHGPGGISWLLHASRRGDPNNSDLRFGGARDQSYPAV